MAGKQRNVQAQNRATLDKIRTTARQVREKSSKFKWLCNVLHSHKLLLSEGILAALTEIPEQEGLYCYCIWISPGARFWDIQVTINESGDVVALETFEEITTAVEINDHLRGIGRSFGSLALEVFHELTLA
jgi:hypothetical protein